MEYKHWIETQRPFSTVGEELAQLAKQGDAFRRLIDPAPDDSLYALGTFLNTFEIGTAHPLLLTLLEANLDDTQWSRISSVIESYILRRAVCGLTNKNYNRVFLGVTKHLRDNGVSAEALERALSAYSGESAEWPNDRAFGTAWKERNVYSGLTGQRCVHLLKRLNDAMQTSKMESVVIRGPLTIEHLLPQQWVEHWPLPDGRRGLSVLDMIISTDEGLVTASERRESLLQTVGNLTLMTQPLNSSVQNRPWLEKRAKIIASSMLPISVQLRTMETWDEEAIQKRSESLFQHALKIWPAPRRA